jgi:hypothetical protein
MYAPGSSTKSHCCFSSKNKLKPIDFVYTWMVVPFFFGIFRLHGKNRTKKSLDLVVDL